jgi:gluconokinase
MILCLESSTTSAKALLFDPEKREVTKVVSEAYPQEVCSAGGEAGLHDAKKIVEQTLDLGHRVCDSINPADIEAIAVGGTFHSVVVCDASMKPVTPTYTWMYNGARQLTSKLRENKDYTKHFYHRTGCMVHALYPAFQLMLLRDAGFNFTDRRIASQSGLVFFALTGNTLNLLRHIQGAGLSTQRPATGTKKPCLKSALKKNKWPRQPPIVIQGRCRKRELRRSVLSQVSLCCHPIPTARLIRLVQAPL